MDNPLWKDSKYKMEIPWSMVHRKIVIRQIALDVTLEELASEFRTNNPLIPLGEMSRFKKKVWKEDSFELKETESVKLTIRSVKCPSVIILWKVRIPVYPFVPQENVSTVASSVITHINEDCSGQERYINCKGAHKNFHPKYPEVTVQISISRVMAELNLGYNEAKKTVVGKEQTSLEPNKYAFPPINSSKISNNGNSTRNANTKVRASILDEENMGRPLSSIRFGEIVKNEGINRKNKEVGASKSKIISDYYYSIIQKDKVLNLLNILKRKEETNELDSFIDNMLILSNSLNTPLKVSQITPHNGDIQNSPVELPKYQE